MNKAEIKLKKLYTLKLRLQQFEQTCDIRKKEWRQLGQEVRSLAQQINQLKEKIIEDIQI